MASLTYVGDGNTGDGATFGTATTSKLSLYGVTPVVQRTSTQLATSLISASTYATIGSNNTAILLELTNAALAFGLFKTA